jgi:uncharacterized repeat protein (TIGR01451 family)
MKESVPGRSTRPGFPATLNPGRLLWPAATIAASLVGFVLAFGLGGRFGAPPPAYAEGLMQSGYCGDGYCEYPENEYSCPSDCGYPATEPPGRCSKAVCGDGVCTEGCETAGSCTADCGESCDDIICGDGVCAWNDCEGSWNCEADCQWCGDGICAAAERGECPEDCPSICGDGVCDADESFASCPSDCEPVCGDGVCNGGETFSTCSRDCEPVCGDGLCQGGEVFASCPADCAPICGDGACEGSETCGSCARDCGVCPASCGDGTCNGSETTQTCPGDCPPECGDGVCNGDETFETCSADCEAPPTEETEEPPEAPELAVVKLAEPASLDEPGGPVTFTIQVTNNGEETVTLTSLEDSLHGDLTDLGDNTCTVPQVLPAGGTYECAYSLGISGAGGESVTNLIAVTAEDTAGQVANGSGSATVLIAAAVPEEVATTGCRIVPLEVVSAGAVNAFAAQSKDYRAPLWMICDEPPEEVCIPIDPSFDTSADIASFTLLDCNSGGACNDYVATSLNEDELCFRTVAGSGQPICAEGCSFMLQTGKAGIPTQVLLLGGIGLALLLLLLLLIVLLMVRRRREVEEEPDDYDSDLMTG